MIEKFNDIEDKRWLKRYLRFIELFSQDSIYKSHKHHILPKSLYLEYESFTGNPWNKCVLSHRAHLIAHYMLAKALGGNMWFAYNNMNAYGVKLNSILYENSMNELSKIASKQRKGMVSAKHKITGERVCITKEEFEKDDNLVGINKGLFKGDKNVSKRNEVREKISTKLSGRVHCIDDKGNRKFIKEEDFNDGCIKITPVNNSGYTAIQTKDGIKRISVEEFKSGNFEHFNKGRKHSEEANLKKSKSLKGKKKSNTDNYKKIRILFNPDGEVVSEFLGDKDLKNYCYNNNLSHARLMNFKNEKVPENNNTKIRGYNRVMNTTGWMIRV